MSTLETFLATLMYLGGTTVTETHYGMLESLMNECGAGLRPKVQTLGRDPDLALYDEYQHPRLLTSRPCPFTWFKSLREIRFGVAVNILTDSHYSE
jgi:hypothetical protein